MTNNLLCKNGARQLVNLRSGPGANNIHQAQPGAPLLCKVDVINKP